MASNFEMGCMQLLDDRDAGPSQNGRDPDYVPDFDSDSSGDLATSDGVSEPTNNLERP